MLDRPDRPRPGVWLLLGLALVLVRPAPLAAATLTVNLEGLEGELRTNVLSALNIYQRRGEDLSPRQIQRLHRRAPHQIKEGLKPLGYFRPRIEADLRQRDGEWTARYRIEPGPPLRVAERRIHVRGGQPGDTTFERLIETFPLREGDVLHQGRYREGKRDFLRAARNRGYFDARFTTGVLRVNLERYRAEIQLDFRTGPRYQFGRIEFEGGGLDESLLRRFVTIEPGEPYRVNRIQDLQQTLYNSGYFRQVQVDPQRDQVQDLRVPIRVILSPRKPHRFRTGIGFGTNTGPRLQLGYELRRVNRSGHRFSTQLETSLLRTEFKSSYTIPLRDPRTDELRFTGSYSREDPDPSSSRVALLETARRRQHGDWLETQALELRHEDFHIGNQFGTVTLLMPSWAWTRTETDDRFNPSWGHRWLGQIRGAYEGVVSEESFLQLKLEAQWIHTIGSYHRFHLRGTAGATQVREVRDLPPTLRYFTGGDRSVRGYPFHSLGPRNKDGDVIGGKHLLVGSMEYELLLTDNWSVAAFYDVGNAVNDLDDSLNQGTGFGVRWQSPIGEVRVDLGFALDIGGTPRRLHIVVGPEL